MMIDATAWLYWKGDDSLIYRLQLESSNKRKLKGVLKTLSSWLSVGESLASPRSSKIVILQSRFRDRDHWRAFVKSSNLDIEVKKA